MTQKAEGSLEVICGSMFSGKTEELLRRLRRAAIAKQKIQVFKPQLDDRYGLERVTSHDGLHIDAQAVSTAREILDLLSPDTTVVGIDEAQFFDWEIANVIQDMAESGVRVIATGLDMDFRGEPFGPMPILLAQAETVDKVRAICVLCGDVASRTQRLVNGRAAAFDDPIIVVGARESYEARCRACHKVAPANSPRVEAEVDNES
jgi:thymidine kinase